MRRMLMGIETEYALGGDSREAVVDAVFSFVRGRVPALRGYLRRDFYLANGSRLYVDAGLHPEYSTPECMNPADVVRYLCAGDRLLARALRELPEPLATQSGAGLYKCNVDYSGAKSTWGSHESYLHRSSPRNFPDEIIPHLVSRVIFTGAGGFNPFSPGIEFTLSPRSWHIVNRQGAGSVGDRGIFHTKDEPLADGGYHRMHLLCGDSLCSQIGNWLRVGTTALVVSAIDAGLRPGLRVPLRDPIAALRAFAADPTCRSRVELKNGDNLAAVDMQRHYLEHAKRHLTRGRAPGWCRDVCAVWERVLDALEEDPESLSTAIDWAIKLAIYKERASQKGIRWDTLPVWNQVIKAIVSAVNESKFQGRATVELVLGKEATPSPIPDAIAALTPWIESHSLNWDMLRPVINLRKELLELDFRFGELGERGVFEGLERAGALTHQAPGVEDIEGAITAAPSYGRAHVRGGHIETSSGREDFVCSWTGSIDLGTARRFDLSDPFVRRGRWRRLTQKEIAQNDTLVALGGLPSSPLQRPPRRSRDVLDLFDE